MILSGEYIVTFIYIVEDTKEVFEYPFTITHEESVEEFAHIIMNTFKIPIYLEKDLCTKLNEFVKKSLNDYYDFRVSDVVESVRNNTYDIEELIKSWEKVYKEETFEYCERRCATDEELFAMAYHKLVHSPVLETMLKLEHNFAKAVKERIKKRDKEGAILKDRQADEMNEAVDNLNITTSERSINELVAKHFEDLSMLQGKWSSELDTVKEVQRRDYRNWVMQILEQNQANSSLPTPNNSPLNTSSSLTFGDSNVYDSEYPAAPMYEESFTIHLGSQLKQMHNIRILSANVLEFCSINSSLEFSEPTPHLLQTALGLYSNDLCGLVLMTDNHVDCYSNMLKDFTDISHASTEFHFSHFEDQLEKVRESIQLSIAVMKSQSPTTAQQQHLQSSQYRKKSKNLQNGDVFITRHSNLAQVHVIFHIVTDDRLLSNEINSRHSVLLGLRNILKTACSNDITSLTIPLLLQYEMTEGMTVAWCTKRAELVFKCVKGFMIEMASWGGSDLKNLQFLLPQGISNSVFMSLTAMLPNIFKLSNPLILKSKN